MTLLKRYISITGNKELDILREDMFIDNDERKIAYIAYNILYKEIYNSLSPKNKEVYYDFLYNNNSDADQVLLTSNVQDFNGRQAYVYDIRFFYGGIKYNFQAILCEPDYKTFGKTVAVYDSDLCVLYLPIINNINKGIMCTDLKRIEDSRWSITHEIKHYIDHLQSGKKDIFNDIPDPSENLLGYYNHEKEYAAFCQEAVDYITKDLLKGIEKDKNNLIFFSIEDNVKQWLDNMLLTHTYEDLRVQELLDVAVFYQHISEDKRKKLAKRISDFYKHIVSPKFESVQNVRNFLITVHKKAYKNPDYYLS